jgi:hypothetical protein
LREDGRVSEDDERFPLLPGEDFPGYLFRRDMEDLNRRTRERYQRAVLIGPAVPLPQWPPSKFLPFRDFIPRQDAAEARALEECDRREWLEGVRRRLGLVSEVHRCRVWRCAAAGHWGWFCQRPDCGCVGHFLVSQAEAAREAQEHTRAFVPEPPEEEPRDELFWTLYEVFVARNENAVRRLSA